MTWRERAEELTDREQIEVSRMVNEAQRTAMLAGCRKSRRGVVVWRGDTLDVLGRGANEPAVGACDRSESCRRDCPRTCVHAEQVAILDAMRWMPRAAIPVRLLHVKIDDKNFVAPSGGPSCVECSKLILTAGIANVYLLHDIGWRSYPAVLFHELTLAELKLYRGPSSALGVVGAGR